MLSCNPVWVFSMKNSTTMSVKLFRPIGVAPCPLVMKEFGLKKNSMTRAKKAGSLVRPPSPAHLRRGLTTVV